MGSDGAVTGHAVEEEHLQLLDGLSPRARAQIFGDVAEELSQIFPSHPLGERVDGEGPPAVGLYLEGVLETPAVLQALPWTCWELNEDGGEKG